MPVYYAVRSHDQRRQKMHRIIFNIIADVFILAGAAPVGDVLGSGAGDAPDAGPGRVVVVPDGISLHRSVLHMHISRKDPAVKVTFRAAAAVLL